MISTTIDTPALEFKGGLYPFTALRIYSTNPELFKQQLENKIKQAPKFFYCAPVIIDLSQFKDDLPEDPDDFFASILDCVRQFKLIPVGVILMPHAPEYFIDSARKIPIAVISESRAAVTPSPLPLPQLTPTRTIIQPVRSGQQIYAPNGDLLVLNAVSHGAELLADGHIHVYGPLRGRALAGISGNEEAHIFCQSLEAELVSIAGRYKVSEDLKDNSLWKKPAKLFLEQGKLQITKL